MTNINEKNTIENLAKKCIHDHRNPIVKVTLPSQKLFFAAKNDEEQAIIEEHQNQFVTVLSHQRVEKSLFVDLAELKQYG